MDLESWNELFPDGKITEADLNHPSEPFLLRILVAYLRKFGYKVVPPFALSAEQMENTYERRLFLIRLSHNIDRMLKITHKNYTFHYYDLVKPVPKKTAKFLDILLNHYYYYNMYKTDVFKTANEFLHERDILMNAIDVASQTNKEQRQKAAEIHDTIDTLSKTIPETEIELKTWQKKTAFQEDQLQKYSNDVKELTEKLAELHAEENCIKKQVVDDNAALKLKNEKTSLEASIDGMRRQIEVLNKTVKERKASIHSLNELREETEKAREIFPAKLIADFKNLMQRIKQSELQINEMKQDKTDLLKTNEEKAKVLKSIEESLVDKKTQFQQEQLNTAEVIGAMESENQKKILQIGDVKNDIHKQDELLAEQHDVSNYIAENLATISRLI